MQLFGDGRVLLDNVFGGAFTKSWEGRTERTTIERILAHLDAAEFPRVESHPIPRGAYLRVILVRSGGAERHTLPIAWSAAPGMKGYGDAFSLLDSLIAELSEGAVRTVKLGEKGLVRRAETPSRPTVALADAYDLGFAPALVGVGLIAKDEAVRRQTRAVADDVGTTIGDLLRKYGRTAPGAPTDPAAFDAWSEEVAWAAEAIVSGSSAESFGLGRAVGAVRLALEEGNRERVGNAFSVLRSSRHAPARAIADLARQAPADFRPRLDELAKALRQALGA